MASSRSMVPEAELEQTEYGLVPNGGGWFVLDMREAEWRHADGRGAVLVYSRLQTQRIRLKQSPQTA